MAKKYEIKLGILKEINHTISIKNDLSNAHKADETQLDDNIIKLLHMWEDVEADEAAEEAAKEIKKEEKAAKAEEKAAKKAAKKENQNINYKPLTRG